MIIDTVAWMGGPDTGFATKRIVLWLLGTTLWIPYRKYWELPGAGPRVK